MLPLVFLFNCRTSSNCVNMKIQSAACPPLRLMSSDPTIRALKVLLKKSWPFWPHSCCFHCCRCCCCPLKLLFALDTNTGSVIISADPSLTLGLFFPCFLFVCLLMSPQHTVMYVCAFFLEKNLLSHGRQFSLQEIVVFIHAAPPSAQPLLVIGSLVFF